MNSEKVKEIKKGMELNEYYAIEYFPQSGEPKIFTFTDLLSLINELEKEKKDYYDRLNNLQTYIDNHEEIWKGNTKIQLKQFAERLIEKKVRLGERFNIYDIDETLKEFINE